MTGLRDAIAEVYRQVDAPAWARPNLDALADVLRDLSWRPVGPVVIRVPPRPAGSADDGRRLQQVLVRAEAESAAGPRPIMLMR